MENALYYFLIFIFGVLFNSFFGFIYGLGHSTLMIKRAISDSLLVMAKNIQSVYEINQLKYMALEMAGKDERFIQFQKSLDEKELSSMRNTVIRNFLNSIPPKYDNIIPFHDWVSAMEYLDKTIKEAKQ